MDFQKKLPRRTRATIALAAALALALFLLALCLAGGRDRLWILMYHDVVPDGTPGTQWAVTVSQLREDLEWLTSHGYTF